LIDVVVFQFPVGPAGMNVQEDYFKRLTEIASDLLGASTIILPTVAMYNNVITEKDTTNLNHLNHLIRSFARTYMSRDVSEESSNSSTVRTIQVLDYAKLIEEYIEVNSLVLGIPSNETYRVRLSNKFKAVVALACAALPYENDPKGCLPGMVSLDGIHLCPETIHGQINAALVCLLDCAYHHDENNDENDHGRGERIRVCSDNCNSRYMTLLNPIEFPPSGELDLTPPR